MLVLSVLITGAGLIGCSAARELLGTEENLIILDTKPDRDLVSDVVSLDDVNLMKADVTDLRELVHIVQQRDVDCIIHTAGILPSRFSEEPLLGFKVNLEGTLNVLEAARREDVETVLFTSSSLVYPRWVLEKTIPIAEDFANLIKGGHTQSAYATAKLAAEYFGANYADSYGINFKALRFPAIWGPWRGAGGSRAQLIFSNMIESLLMRRKFVVEQEFSGREGAELLFSVDAGRAIALARRAAKTEKSVFNIGTGELYTLDGIIATAKRLIPNSKVLVHESRAGSSDGFFRDSSRMDIRLAKSMLGYKPEYPLELSMKIYIDKMKSWLHLKKEVG